MTKNPETNEAPKDKGPSILDTLNAAFEKEHKGKTTKKRVAELVTNYTKAQSARIAADAAVESAKVAETIAARALITEACGKSKVTIAGVLYTPMTRGDRVFFRKESGESIDLG